MFKPVQLASYRPIDNVIIQLNNDAAQYLFFCLVQYLNLFARYRFELFSQTVFVIVVKMNGGKNFRFYQPFMFLEKLFVFPGDFA